MDIKISNTIATGDFLRIVWVPFLQKYQRISAAQWSRVLNWAQVI
jgi:hypothetical protein